MKKYNKPVVVPPSARIMTELDEMSLAQRIGVCASICYKSEGKLTSPASAEGLAKKMVKSRHNSTLEMSPVTMLVVVQVNQNWDGRTRHQPMILELFESLPKYLVIDDIGGERYLVSGTIRSFRELVMTHPDCKIGWAMARELWSTGLFADITPPDFGLSTDISARKMSLEEVEKLSPEWHINHRHVAVKFIVNRAVTHEIVRHRPTSFLQESQRYCRYSGDQFNGRVTFIKPMFFEEGGEAYKLWEKAMLETEAVYLTLVEEKDENGKQKHTAQAARTVLPNSCKTELIMQANLVEWEHFFHLRCSQAAEPSMREITIPLREEFRKMFPQHSFDRRMPEGWGNSHRHGL